MLPDFVIIGAMKAGTTSLYAYLRSHPDVFLAEPKELDFFVKEKNWERGLAWYEERFANANGAKAVGEASPNYTKFPAFDGVPERMSRYIPEAKLIYVVRDPIERMRSHWIHHVSHSGLNRPIAEALIEQEHFRLCSSYGLQLERYLEFYPREHVLVITSEDLRDRRAEQLRRVFDFIGVESSFQVPNLMAEFHRSAGKRAPRQIFEQRPELRRRLESVTGGKARRLTTRAVPDHLAKLSADAEATLRGLLRPDMERLRSILGPDFHAWGLLDPSPAVGFTPGLRGHLPDKGWVLPTGGP